MFNFATSFPLLRTNLLKSPPEQNTFASSANNQNVFCKQLFRGFRKLRSSINRSVIQKQPLIPTKMCTFIDFFWKKSLFEMTYYRYRFMVKRHNKSFSEWVMEPNHYNQLTWSFQTFFQPWGRHSNTLHQETNSWPSGRLLGCGFNPRPGARPGSDQRLVVPVASLLGSPCSGLDQPMMLLGCCPLLTLWGSKVKCGDSFRVGRDVTIIGTFLNGNNELDKVVEVSVANLVDSRCQLTS